MSWVLITTLTEVWPRVACISLLEGNICTYEFNSNLDMSVATSFHYVLENSWVIFILTKTEVIWNFGDNFFQKKIFFMHRIKNTLEVETIVAEFYLRRLLLFSCSVVFGSLWPYELQHARLPCPSPSPAACSNSCPLSQWCHSTI